MAVVQMNESQVKNQCSSENLKNIQKGDIYRPSDGQKLGGDKPIKRGIVPQYEDDCVRSVRLQRVGMTAEQKRLSPRGIRTTQLLLSGQSL
jgi:hypothetical protein